MTSKWEEGLAPPHTARPVWLSTATALCSWLIRIGDLPGMYQVWTVCGQ